MDFAFSEDQELLRAAARDFLADRWPNERVIAAADSEPAFDAAAWKELANLGWLDSGLGVLEHAVLAEETGTALLPLPWFSSAVLATPLLAGDELLAGIESGDRAVALAWAEPGAFYLRETGGGVTESGGKLTGRKVVAPDLASVTDVIVTTNDGLWVVDLLAQPGVVQPLSTVDRTRRLADLNLDGTTARRLATPVSALADVRRRALAMAACEAVGVAQRALDLAADYTKTRQQFGRVIGTYQGVSHRVANIYVQVQLARSLAYWAAWAVSEGDAQQDIAVAAAKSAATEAAVFACENAIQAHGGIGFTWEHVLHRYYKRAQWLDAFEGFGRDHRADVASAVLDGTTDEGTAA
ncbi:MAG: acyl-CoA/acyl-ACP dehydrogenase [Frankiales bacterium]|nr:acyl-CoA/acyl-ACP dehydrogenase [Frankiales bacterium]